MSDRPAAARMRAGSPCKVAVTETPALMGLNSLVITPASINSSTAGDKAPEWNPMPCFPCSARAMAFARRVAPISIVARSG